MATPLTSFQATLYFSYKSEMGDDVVKDPVRGNLIAVGELMNRLWHGNFPQLALRVAYNSLFFLHHDRRGLPALKADEMLEELYEQYPMDEDNLLKDVLEDNIAVAMVCFNKLTQLWHPLVNTMLLGQSQTKAILADVTLHYDGVLALFEVDLIQGDQIDPAFSFLVGPGQGVFSQVATTQKVFTQPRRFNVRHYTGPAQRDLREYKDAKISKEDQEYFASSEFAKLIKKDSKW